MNDVIIIGAGAAGLMAAHDLLNAGYRVCLLEAAGHAGGRIRTLTETCFDQPIEAGAEFIHGKLPLTFQLLKDAGIAVTRVTGKMIRVQRNGTEENEPHDDHWPEFMRVLSELKTDKSLLDLLNERFADDYYRSLRKSVQNFAEGFDLADISRASALFLKEEWAHENDTQFRVQGGYVKLVEYLLKKSSSPLITTYFNAFANRIEHKKEKVIVHTSDKRVFEARSLIITVSAGILQSGSIEFIPALPAHTAAFRQLGFGSVIKILLQFKTPFWKDHYSNPGFILSDEIIPTWWTQSPADSYMLTGWRGGPGAKKMAGESSGKLLSVSLQSLSGIFKIPYEVLEKELICHHFNCWDDDPFTKGGYSYPALGSAEAKNFLSQPINDTIFFAGEALHEGDSQGTVEAALQNGRLVAAKLMTCLERYSPLS